MRDRQRIQDKVVGQEHQTLACIRIDILDASQGSQILGGALYSREPYGLIIANSGRFVDRTFRSATTLEVLLGAGDEESHMRLKDVESGEINVAAVHHIERAGLQGEKVEGIDIVQFSRGNVDKTRDVAAQIDQGV
jgi:hypothetical protein